MRAPSSWPVRWFALVTAGVLLATVAAVVQPAAAASPSADLAVVLSHTPAGPSTGQDIRFTIKVSNSGPDAAVNVVTALPLPYELEVRSVASSVGSCQSQQGAPLVICRVASLGPSQVMTATVVLRSELGGVAHLEAAVLSDTADPNGANDTGENTLIVQLGPPWAEQAAVGYFRDILGRAPGAAELASWARRIEAARSSHLSDIAFILLSSREYRRARIVGVYQATLGRSPGSAGLSYWLGYLSRGGTFEGMTVQIVGSSEFLRRSGGTQGFVDAAYHAILGRAADTGALRYWNARLAAGMTPGQVANSLQFSAEELTRITNSRFQTVLHRAPSTVERNYWRLGFRLGRSVERQVSYLFSRGEYLDQFTDPYCCLGGGGYGAAASAAAQARRALHTG